MQRPEVIRLKETIWEASCATHNTLHVCGGYAATGLFVLLQWPCLIVSPFGSQMRDASRADSKIGWFVAISEATLLFVTPSIAEVLQECLPT